MTTETKVCPFCGKPMPTQATHCPSCGEALAAIKTNTDGETAIGTAVNRTAADVIGSDTGTHGEALRDAQYELVLHWDGQTSLRGFDLANRNLSALRLAGADLRGANLSAADLSGADLSGANLRLADLRGALLTGVIYTDKTFWPRGFTPAGMALKAP
jgi:hypothetical protein